MKWITKPNEWYDKIEEPNRLLIMIGVCAIPQIINMLINGRTEIGLAIFMLIGVYRIIYCIIIDSRKLTQAKS